MNTTRKKQEEIRHISNLLDAIRCEFGGIVRLDEEERPDFIVTLPDGTKIGIEETMCCPSASQDGSPRFKYYNWKEKVRKASFQNEYLIEKSQDKRLHINIRETPKIYRGKHSVKECCEEIEKHLRNALEPTINPIPVPNLILYVEAHYIDSACNIINFSHAARRDPIKAKELIVSIKHKEQKRKEYNHDNIWLYSLVELHF